MIFDILCFSFDEKNVQLFTMLQNNFNLNSCAAIVIPFSVSLLGFAMSFRLYFVTLFEFIATFLSQLKAGLLPFKVGSIIQNSFCVSRKTR